jgi:hypothetical protein
MALPVFSIYLLKNITIKSPSKLCYKPIVDFFCHFRMSIEPDLNIFSEKPRTQVQSLEVQLSVYFSISVFLLKNNIQ